MMTHEGHHVPRLRAELRDKTTATTNTRCRRCRKVVNVGNDEAGRPATPRAVPIRRGNTREPDQDEHEPDEEPAGGGWSVAALLAAAVALAIFLGRRS
jgi:hypothetical protein